MVASALKGTIVAYAITDGVGRIQLDDGEELRFSVRALSGVVPAVGVHVSIGDTEPYPLGGRRALAITLDEDRATYDRRKKEFEKAQGEAMRGDLGRRAAELHVPIEKIAPVLLQGKEPDAPATPRASRRAQTARPAERPASRPGATRAASAGGRPKRPAGKSSRGNRR